MADTAKVDIYNDVLGLLGFDDIIDVEDSQLARGYRLAQHYNAALRRILSLHDWGFATVTEKLQLETSLAKPPAPEIERRVLEFDALYRARWTYPADCQRIIGVGFYHNRGGMETFRFDHPRQYVTSVGESGQRVILTQWPNACAKYVTDRVMPAMWPATFRDAVIAEIASRMALRTEFAGQMRQAAVIALNTAQVANRKDFGTNYYPGDFVMSRSIDFERDGYR